MVQPVKLPRTTLVTTVLFTVYVVSASAASVGVGTVNIDALRLRGEASASATVLDTVSEGDTVVVLGDAGNDWYRVDYEPVEGHMSGECPNVSARTGVTIGYGLVQSQGSPPSVRSGPGTSYSRVTSLNNGAVVNIVSTDNGWYKIPTSGVTGYVNSDHMVTYKDSAGSRSDGAAVMATAPSSNLGQQVADYARQYLGRPCVHGGSGPSSPDCSGYTSYAYRRFGYTLNRIASTQLSNDASISRSEPQPGGLAFLKYNTSRAASHVGICIGGGQFIHASTNTYTVKIDDLIHDHYASVYVGARRIL